MAAGTVRVCRGSDLHAQRGWGGEQDTPPPTGCLLAPRAWSQVTALRATEGHDAGLKARQGLHPSGACGNVLRAQTHHVRAPPLPPPPPPPSATRSAHDGADLAPAPLAGLPAEAARGPAPVPRQRGAGGDGPRIRLPAQRVLCGGGAPVPADHPPAGGGLPGARPVLVHG
jgi:hypothetical protein